MRGCEHNIERKLVFCKELINKQYKSYILLVCPEGCNDIKINLTQKETIKK